MSFENKTFHVVLAFKLSLTWDVVRRKEREGGGRCHLCNIEKESKLHLTMECSFTRFVLLEIGKKLNKKSLWK